MKELEQIHRQGHSWSAGACLTKRSNRTEEHFRSMRQKLEPKTVQIAVPTQQESPEVLHVNVRNDDPPYVNLEKFNRHGVFRF